MFRKITLVVTVALVLALSITAQQIYVPVLVDLTHGEASKGLDFWVNSTANPLAISDFAQLYILIPATSGVDPLAAKLNASRMAVVLRGDLSTIDLSKFKVIILGQPPKALTDAELAAIKKWFESGGKVLWCAADSDYPAQGSEESQVACNDIAEYLGAHIRVDYVSVEDSKHNAGRGYRVVGVVDPPPQLAFLGFMAQRVLFHGPGAISVVLPDGTWVPANSPEVSKYYNNIFVIVHTTENGAIVESRTSADGKGRDGKAYKAGDRGVFPLMAVEFMPSGSVLILSGETPYGGYEPGVAPVYYGVRLDGPRFFRNLLLWATGNYRELSTMVETTNFQVEISKKLDALSSDVGALKGDVASLKQSIAQTNSLSGQINSVSSQLGELNNKIAQLSKQLEAATAEANNARTVAFVGTALALIFAIAAAFLALRRK